MDKYAARIDEALLQKTIAAAPAGDLYIFGYGSLMWRPGFCYRSVRRARVFGYSRRCAVWSHHYRGTVQRPGLVLGLDAGGSCNGVCYCVGKKNKAKIIRYLFSREMFADVYHPRYVRAYSLDENICYQALTFIVRRNGRQYAPPMADAACVNVIQTAAGFGGSNREYMLSTWRHLQELGIDCAALKRLCRLL